MGREHISSLVLGAILVAGMLMTGCTEEKEAAPDESSLAGRATWGGSCFFDTECGNHLKCTKEVRKPYSKDSPISFGRLKCRCKSDACCYSRPDVEIVEDVHCYRDFYENKVRQGTDLQCDGIKKACDRWTCQCFQRMKMNDCQPEDCFGMRKLCEDKEYAVNLDIISKCTANP